MEMVPRAGARDEQCLLRLSQWQAQSPGLSGNPDHREQGSNEELRRAGRRRQSGVLVRVRRDPRTVTRELSQSDTMSPAMMSSSTMPCPAPALVPGSQERV